MEQEHKNLKPLLLAATAAVTVIAILLVFFFSGRKSESTQTIILPDPPAQEQAPDEEQPEASLAELTRENVQSVLKKSVARPSSYHQSMQIVITSGDIQRTQTAELWVKGELVKAQITDELETKTILADATTLYVWYDDEEPVQMARGAGMRTEPSSLRLFSRNAISMRGGATQVLLSVWAKYLLPSLPLMRMPRRRACASPSVEQLPTSKYFFWRGLHA